MRIDQLAGTNVRTTETVEKPATTPTVVLRDGLVTKVVLGDDVFPAVVLQADTRLDDLAEHSGLMRMLLRRPPVVAGVVVLDGARVTGFVPRDTLLGSLVVEAAPRDVDHMGSDSFGSDPLLHGEPTPVHGAVRIRCRTCDVVGGYDFYLPGEPLDCVGGHPLDADL